MWGDTHTHLISHWKERRFRLFPRSKFTCRTVFADPEIHNSFYRLFGISTTVHIYFRHLAQSSVSVDAQPVKTMQVRVIWIRKNRKEQWYISGRHKGWRCPISRESLGSRPGLSRLYPVSVQGFLHFPISVLVSRFAREHSPILSSDPLH